MKKKIRYTDKPLAMEVVRDFLPPPEQLVLKPDAVKVTLNLSKTSVAFFKKQAKKHKTPYQKMIRRVLELYASKYE
ncbi:MAG: CopG family transcriptional regulator [Deltaproteobacteria bacterium RBG_13_61_14]|nr:MAG: CopG family transcriptional regulator [Deltaproteobacteria bacterium RBG_13_61_14]